MVFVYLFIILFQCQNYSEFSEFVSFSLVQKICLSKFIYVIQMAKKNLVLSQANWQTTTELKTKIWNWPKVWSKRIKIWSKKVERIFQIVILNIVSQNIWFDKERIFALLNDDKVVGMPLNWIPRLNNATDEQRSKVEYWSNGTWLHWEELDKDISAEGFLKFSK